MGPGPFMPPMPPGHMSILNFADDLDLTSGQIEKLIVIEKESKKVEEKVMSELRANMEDMRKEIDKDNPDGKKVDELINKISENHKVIMKNQFQSIIKIKSVLTKKQQQILKEKIKSESDKMMGKGFPGPPNYK